MTAKNLIRLVIVAIVVWGIARAFGHCGGIHGTAVELEWVFAVRVVVSDCHSRCGLVGDGLGFWFAVLRALQQRPSFAETIRAYYIGHLGKYVPGKAMVIVLRTGLIRGANVDTTMAGISVLIETLTMMASGAFLAAVVLSIQYRENRVLLGSAIGTMLLTVVPTLPPVFCAVVRRLRPQFQSRLGELADAYSFRLVAVGWLASTAGWIGLTVSLCAARGRCRMATRWGVSG